jgi:hypothetical protein
MVTEEGRYQTRERDRECTRSRERLQVAARVQPAFMLADLPSARQAGGSDPEFDMRDNPISEEISRRHALSLIGMAAAVAVAGPAAVLTTTEAQAQQPVGGQSPPQAAPRGQPGTQTTGQGAPQTAGTPQTGTERRQARRTARAQRRIARRNARRQAREARRAMRRGQSVGAGGASAPSSTPSSTPRSGY